MRIYLGIALALLALASPTSGADWDRWFHVSWGPEPEGKTPTSRIEGFVRNDSPYRVTDVQLEIEGLSADERSVGRRIVWALGDIESGGASSRRCPTLSPIASASPRSMSCRPRRRTDGEACRA